MSLNRLETEPEYTRDSFCPLVDWARIYSGWKVLISSAQFPTVFLLNIQWINKNMVWVEYLDICHRTCSFVNLKCIRFIVKKSISKQNRFQHSLRNASIATIMSLPWTVQSKRGCRAARALSHIWKVLICIVYANYTSPIDVQAQTWWRKCGFLYFTSSPKQNLSFQIWTSWRWMISNVNHNGRLLNRPYCAKVWSLAALKIIPIHNWTTWVLQ